MALLLLVVQLMSLLVSSITYFNISNQTLPSEMSSFGVAISEKNLVIFNGQIGASQFSSLEYRIKLNSASSATATATAWTNSNISYPVD
jgi:hypothetical protein